MTIDSLKPSLAGYAIPGGWTEKIPATLQGHREKHGQTEVEIANGAKNQTVSIKTVSCSQKKHTTVNIPSINNFGNMESSASYKHHKTDLIFTSFDTALHQRQTTLL